LALSVVVNVEEGAEMSILDGDSRPEPVDELGMEVKARIRNYANESNYLYGIKEGVHRIGDVLTDLSVPATWTAAAVALERAPRIATLIRRRGDEVASHGYRWVHQFRMSEAEERAFLQAARRSIADSIGVPPSGHYSRYLFTDKTREILVEEGFTYHMDDYSGDEPFWAVTPAGSIVVVPYALDTNDIKLWHDGGYTPRDWCEYLVDSFDQLYSERREGFRMMSVGLHLRITGRPGRIGALRRFLEHVRSHEDVWLARRGEIAAAFAATVPAPGSELEPTSAR
jgi:peptidoglycan/xylan/chitin deacetylase (PgdA/CDA1 family)